MDLNVTGSQADGTKENPPGPGGGANRDHSEAGKKEERHCHAPEAEAWYWDPMCVCVRALDRNSHSSTYRMTSLVVIGMFIFLVMVYLA